MQSALDEVGRILDGELVSRLERLVKVDRAVSAKLLVHLGEVDTRGLYRERAFSSMFGYCLGALGMSEGEAGLRVLAARVIRKFPLVGERLGAGAVHLSGIKLIAPLLTSENQVQLLDRVRGMTKRQIEVLVADLAPKPDVPARMRKVRERRGSTQSGAEVASLTACNTAASAATNFNAATDASNTTHATDASNTTHAAHASNTTLASAASDAVAVAGLCSTALPGTAAVGSARPSASGSLLPLTAAGGGSASQASTFVLQSPRPRATSTPLGLGRFNVKLTLGREAHTALEQLVELFRHQNPSGDFTMIVERALCELLKSTMKRRFGQTEAKQPRVTRERANPGPRIEPEAKLDVAAKAKSPDVPGRYSCDGRAGIGLIVENRFGADVRARCTPDVEAKAKSAKERSPKSRYVPRAVLREVHARDMGQCTYVSSDGRRCIELGFLEMHHHNTTFARGGAATAENMRLVCRAHNLLFAERDYGRGLMQGKLREAATLKQQLLVPAIPGTEHV
ncbi:MAG TPA: hypothetical protein VFN67_19830 [Polyangiales bacterium]|nr:hypothetical protein [Polyangiales bacterium]